MSYQFTLSDIGLRLIKAYEGYHPEGRPMRDGRRLVGYGEISDDPNIRFSQVEAEEVLKSKLSAVEHVVNTHVHAAMSQSQFDALCSLAHSIGTDTFLGSDVLHALNQGKVIAAANGFDAWRLGNIDGQVYVVDALVRRRTAEKALFLRPNVRTAPAPKELLRTGKDTDNVAEKIVTNYNEPAAAETAKPALPAITESNIVTLYDTVENGGLKDKAVQDGDDADILQMSDKVQIVPEDAPSPIAEAAAEVSERLDALMEDDADTDLSDWPDSLVTTPDETETDTLEFNGSQNADIVIDYSDGTIDDIQSGDSADRYITPAVTTDKQNIWAFVTMMIFGLTAAGGGLWASLKNSDPLFGDLTPLIYSSAVAVGVLLFLMGLYYLIKHLIGRS